MNDLDLDIVDRSMLDAEHSVNFPKPFIGEDSECHQWHFDTEEEACAFQRGWRAARNLDIMTGEPL